MRMMRKLLLNDLFRKYYNKVPENKTPELHFILLGDQSGSSKIVNS